MMLRTAGAGLTTPAVAGRGLSEGLGVSACMMPVPYNVCTDAKHEHEKSVDTPSVAFDCGRACITFVPYERLRFGSNAHHFASQDAYAITRTMALDPLHFGGGEF